MKVYLTTLGCKLNESELEAWTRQFAERGDEIVRDAREADLCIVNTCTVTQAAAKKSRLLARKTAQLNPAAPVVLTGCYATMSREEALRLPNVAFVVPNPDKDRLVELAARYHGDPSFERVANGCRMPEAASGELAHPRTRAFVKIEDGCNMSCTYCIIPLARGRSRSRPQAEIVAEVRGLVESGYQEVILTGVQISDYRYDEREPGQGRLRALNELVRAILSETSLPRLRLTSIAPWELEEEFLDLFADSRLCRHLHLSLQSGSTTVLRRMRRPYSAEQFADAVAMARARVPEVGITTDVIVGFPGESQVEFDQSCEFVERIQFARVHVFPYSARAGTAAATLPLPVADPVKDARARAMQAVADQSIGNFVQRFVGRTLPVLYEAESSMPGVWSGYTDNYIRVIARSQENLANRIIPTKIVEVIEDGARGEVTHHAMHIL
ncbi:MAG: tRNA (N(6)-L-threonylcarbamoyladenosine(37)-C(2))-methylthiotransferase MtaB [Anaerolineae bacterium]